MQLGIIGLPKVGKTTLFNTLTSLERETGKFSVSREVNVGVAQIADPRLEKLRELFSPRRYAPATVEYVDLPGLRKGAFGEGADLSRLRDVDALVHVVRAFEEPEILHEAGDVNPGRDAEDLDLELILADHDLVVRRLERLGEAVKRGLSDDEKREQTLLEEVIVPALEEESPLRDLELSADHDRRLRGFQLLSAKPLLVVLNVGEERLTEPWSDVQEAIGESSPMVVISAPIEEEISHLDPSDQRELLDDLGLEESSTTRLIRASYELLGLVSFFTVGEDEVKAWTISRGTRAREAAGKIHSDIERGFIRAEVVGWEYLLDLGSLSSCREAARLRLEGKDYEVGDGEVVHFRFNV